MRAGLTRSASLILSYLAINTSQALAEAERWLEKPITLLPPGPPVVANSYTLKLLLPIDRPVTVSRSLDDRQVLMVAPNSRLPTTGAYHRYQQIKPGMMVDQLLRRGVTRRDLREWTRSGELILSK